MASVVGPGPLEAGCGVALLALWAEPARVHVVLRVASAANHGRLDDVLRLEMALGATDLRMRSRQREERSCRMVEIPQFPAVRGVALRAGLGECAVVDIISRVARIAVLGGLLEALRHMALAAGRGHVQAQERVGGQVMVESDIAPFRVGVALLTRLVPGRAMRAGGSMAAHTVRAEFLFLQRRRVTGVAIHLGMGSCQFEFRMTVGGDPPKIVAVTVTTGGAEAAFVPIIRLVAAGAVFRHRRMEVATAMAVRAANVSVPSEKGEARLAGVVEFLCRPISSGVTVAALLALAPLVDVVRRVATHTFTGRSFVAVPRMAGDTRGLQMPVGQGKGRRGVIEAGLLPGSGVVAGNTVRPEGTAMTVLPGMATVAGRWGLATGFARFVTTVAGQSDVGVLQWEVGQIVVEAGLAHPGDAGVAAQVLGVAATALTRGRLPHVSVKTALTSEIPCNLLVAGEAESILPFAIREVVALGAFGLDRRVRLGDRSGHDELLDARRPGVRAD